jgi:hypothetical protein
MPVNPVTFTTDGNVTAKYLNTTLYTFTPGNNFTPNGILYTANRQLLFEALQSAASGQASSPTGVFTSTTGAGFAWLNFFDSASLFGGGGDTQWQNSSGRYNPAVPGSAGAAGQNGGYHLIWGSPNFSSTTNAGVSGAALNENGTVVPGGYQLSSTAHNNGPYVLDLVSASSGQFTSLEGFCADASSSSFSFTTVGPTSLDWSGQQTRFYGTWVCVSTGGATTGTGSPPTPTAWTPSSAVTSSLLSGAALGNPLKFLYNPPVFRVGTTLSTAITANTNTLVPLTTAQIDSWGAWSAGSNTYTVPVTGVYLVHGMTWYTAASTGSLLAGIRVNGGTVWWGPGYATGAVSTNHSAQVTRLLDLQQGDTVQLFTNASSTDALSNTQPSRLLGVWLSTLAGSNGSVAWPAPDVGFRWQAGTPGSNLTTSSTNLTAQFQTHLTGDLSFFLQRPYMLAWQNTAQTGLSQNAWHTITMDTLGGIVHASAGDNYGGWTSGASNKYSAPVSGWYLVQGGFIQATASATASLMAGVLASPPGASLPDTYQHISTNTVPTGPGADAIGIYYLRAGDSVMPQYQQQDGGATFSTNVTAGHQSNFGVVWLCE